MFFLSLSPIAVLAEKHHSAALSFKTTAVADNIWMLQGKGGNIAVMTGEQGLLMIDD